MKAPDRNAFQRAMHKDFNDHTVRQYWELLPIDQVSEVKKVMDSVWAMKRKRNIVTNEIYKWKVRLNLHGGQQEYAVNFYETFSPVVSWISTRLLLIHSIIYKWHTKQVDFALAFPQADIEIPMYMKLLVGIKIKEGNKKYARVKIKEEFIRTETR